METGSTDPSVSVSVGGTPATDAAVTGGWVYATIPSMAIGDYSVVLTQGGVPQGTGTISYVADLASAAQGAVASYGVSLQELVARLGSAGSDNDRAQILADRDIWGNAVDDAIAKRAAALGSDLDTPDIEAAWSSATSTIGALEAQLEPLQGEV